MTFAAGQRWTYRAPEGFAGSRIVIGAIVNFGNGERAVCAAVAGACARQADGGFAPVTIPFLPLSQAAFEATVVEPDGMDTPPPAFFDELKAWSSDSKGLVVFTVPFEGSLERIIGRQMEAIVAPVADSI